MKLSTVGAAKLPSLRTDKRLVWVALALALIGFAPVVPVNHDEGQYLAAAALTGPGLPFVDFLYLQTPLQPFVTAPIVAIANGYSFIALRIATAITALAALWFVFGCQRQLGVGERTALAATALMALTYSFQFGSTVVRNDILPAMLLSAGLYAAIAASRGARHGLLWLMAGVAFGAAVGTKLSYALPALGVGSFHMLTLLRHRNQTSLIDAAACALGALISFVPVAVLYMQGPAAFLYGVFEYGAEAPFHWYRLNGLEYRLGLDWKLIDTATALLRGPACVALAVVAVVAFRPGRRTGSYLLLDLLIVAGIAAALLPTPTWRQYLLPVLPPLFVRFGLAWHEGSVTGRWRPIVMGACALAALAGLVQPGLWVARIMKGKANPITMTREAHWIGDRLRAAGLRGEIATFSPQVMIDSGFSLDPRFATGPFAYRSGNLLSDEKQRAVHIVSPRTLDRFLAERPPDAIVIGYESRAQFDRIDLDAGLRAFAVKNAYRAEFSPFGAAELFVRSGPLRSELNGQVRVAEIQGS